MVRDGYTAAFVERVDPSHGLVGAAALVTRAPVDDPSRVVRGRVVNQHGRLLSAAVGGAGRSRNGGAQQVRVDKGPRTHRGHQPKGELELAYSEKATGMILRVEARGMATKLIAVPTGPGRETLTVSDGALIRGHLVNHGRPVAGAEVGLIAQDRGGFLDKLKVFGHPYEEIRIGTQEDGSFVITNVPAP